MLAPFAVGCAVPEVQSLSRPVWLLLAVACVPYDTAAPGDVAVLGELTERGLCGDLVGWATTADGTRRVVVLAPDAPVDATLDAGDEPILWVWPLPAGDAAVWLELADEPLPDPCVDPAPIDGSRVYRALQGELHVEVVPREGGADALVFVDSAVLVGHEGSMAMPLFAIPETAER